MLLFLLLHILWLRCLLFLLVFSLLVPLSCKNLIRQLSLLYAHSCIYSQGNKTPLIQQLQTAVVASVLLGFGAIFASNAAGVYL